MVTHWIPDWLLLYENIDGLMINLRIYIYIYIYIYIQIYIHNYVYIYIFVVSIFARIEPHVMPRCIPIPSQVMGGSGVVGQRMARW